MNLVLTTFYCDKGMTNSLNLVRKAKKGHSKLISCNHKLINTIPINTSYMLMVITLQKLNVIDLIPLKKNSQGYCMLQLCKTLGSWQRT